MLTIRPIDDGDIDELAVLHVRVWRVAYAGIIPSPILDALDPADLARRRRARSLDGTFLAFHDDTMVGFAAAGPHRSLTGGELYALYVDPDHWGTGAGSRLFRHAAGHLRDQGFTRMLLWVLEANDRGRAFYERMGMRPDGVRDFWTPRGADVRLPELQYETRL